MLAMPTSSSSSGAWVHQRCRVWAVSSDSSPSARQDGPQRGGVHAVGDAGVHAFERVVEAPAEGPAGVLPHLGQGEVGAVVQVGVRLGGRHHMWGTSSATS